MSEHARKCDEMDARTGLTNGPALPKRAGWNPFGALYHERTDHVHGARSTTQRLRADSDPGTRKLSERRPVIGDAGVAAAIASNHGRVSHDPLRCSSAAALGAPSATRRF